MFTILQDGAWHSLKEIAEETKIPIEELEKHCEKLSKQGLIDYNPDAGIVRFGHQFKKMVMKLRAEEEAKWEKKGAGTIIIPPEKGFQIQGVYIHNMTEQDIQFELTFNKKLKEIVISKA